MGRWVRSFFLRSASPLRRVPSSGFKMMSNAEKMEEENWDWYGPGLFYPVRIGEVFQSRYQVLGKLGYGSRSTAWLCRDLRWVWQYHQARTTLTADHRKHKYVTLKMCEPDSPTTRRELAAYSHLDAIATSNPGALLVRQLLDSFTVTGSAGEHQCLVHEPLGMSMETLRQLSPGQKLPKDLLKVFLIHVSQTLDFLHTDAEMIHTGIKKIRLRF